MRSLGRAAASVVGLIAVATLSQFCGSSNHSVSPLIITSTSLSNGTVETQYNQSVQATGGVAPYHWTHSGTLPHNLQLGPSVTNTDTISGTPDTVQKEAFTIEVTDAANQSASQPYTVSILGLPDTVTISPATLMFSPQLNGTASMTQAATLTNTGSASIVINSVASTGSNAGDFSQTNSCAAGVTPGANCTITVTFTPSQAGPRVATITINDDTVGTPHTLGLNGIGLSPGANATLSGQNLTFSDQAVGTTSPAQTLTLTNYGTATLNIAGIAATANFAETSTCGASLPSAASCPISVTFAPSALGDLTGTLSVRDNLTDSPQTASLSGTGATSKGTLSGSCFGTTIENCNTVQDLASCPVGTVAITPAEMTFNCPNNPNPQPQHVDSARACQGNSRTGHVTGLCLVN